MPIIHEAGEGKEERVEQTLTEFTGELWQMLQDNNGRITVSGRIMRKALHDENEEINPKLGVSNSDWIAQMGGPTLPSKTEVFTQWCVLNGIMIKYNEDEGDLVMWLMKGTEDDKITKPE